MEEMVKGGEGAAREESLVCNDTLTQISPSSTKHITFKQAVI